jgi:hypothetical protein
MNLHIYPFSASCNKKAAKATVLLLCQGLNLNFSDPEL